MFGKMRKNMIMAIFILFLVGCGASYSVDTGVEPTEMLVLDGDFEFSETIEKGEVIALDMRLPIKSGYVIIGASFDPEILKLEHYIEYTGDEEPRARYMFTALADGMSDVLVKMQPKGGGDVEVFKRISINIGEKNSLF